MLVNRSGTVAVSNMGWVEQGGLWTFDARSKKTETLVFRDASGLSLKPGHNDVFAVLHHLKNDRIELTALSFDNPKDVLSTIEFKHVSGDFSGDRLIWEQLPRVYMSFAFKDYHLFILDWQKGRVESQPIGWLLEGYDRAYQGFVDVTEIPDEPSLILLSIARDAHPLIYDYENQKVISKIVLANRSGNPALRFRSNSKELWGTDYDTLVRVNAASGEVLNSARLQPAPKGTAQFIGKFCFNTEETLCIVARPFSGDAVGINTRTFQITHHAKLGKQPLEIGIVDADRIIARDWKTGVLLEAKLEPIRG